MTKPVVLDPIVEAGRVTLFHVVTIKGEYVDELGSSRGVSNAADLDALLRARSDNDVAVTGGNTARVEKLKSTARCFLCVVSNSLATLTSPALTPSSGHTVFLASSNPALLDGATDRTGVESIRLSDRLPLAKQLVDSLGALGLKRVLLEGGPELIRAFTVDLLIDAIHLTVTGSTSELSNEEARSIVSKVSYLPNVNDSLAVSFDGVNNYLVWCPSGVAA